MNIMKLMTTSILTLGFVAFHSVGVAQVPQPQTGGHDQAEHQFGFDYGNVLQVITRQVPGSDNDLEFVLSDDEVSAGWVTIRHINTTDESHSIDLTRVPEAQSDMTREDYQTQVTNPFQEAWQPYFAGEQTAEDFTANVEAQRPGWFADATPSGGPGLISGGRTGWTTVNLQPGTYFLESRTLDEAGNFASSRGLVERLVVTEPEPGAPETQQPEADLQVNLSSANGMQFDDDVDQQTIQPGLTTIETVFEDNMVYDHGLGHDMQLIRLDQDTDVDQLNDWVDFMDAGEDGFYANRNAMVSTPDSPGPQTFVGGVGSVFHPQMSDSTPQSSFMHVNLTPGRYALVSRVPNPSEAGDQPDATLLQEFNVSTGAGLTGSWYDPETDGQGWNFMAAPNGVFGFFYGYNDQGESMWLLTEEVIQDIQGGEPVTVTLLSGHGQGGSFNDPVHPDDLAPWGEVTLTFESCDEATAEMSGPDGTSTHQLERIGETVGLPDCGL